LHTDGKGVFTGTARVEDDITLDKNGDKFTATWTFKGLGQTQSGTLKATRIKAQRI
jgi:hypothetical protein